MLALLIALLTALHAPLIEDAPSSTLPQWELDEEGLRQWTHATGPCTTCKGAQTTPCIRCATTSHPVCEECDKTQTATCRDCAGEGVEYDPLVERVCPYCAGSALYPCPNCFGKGSYGVVGGGRKDQKCGPCKGAGALPCLSCKGDRKIESARADRKGPAEASAKELAAAIETLKEVRGSLTGYSARGDESKDRKTFFKHIKPAKKLLPALKRTEKMVDSALKALRISAQFERYELWVKEEFDSFNSTTIALLDDQIALLHHCHERSVFNNEVTGK